MQLLFDVKCQELADHFLHDYVEVSTQERRDLAEYIQQEIEAWFESRTYLKAK